MHTLQLEVREGDPLAGAKLELLRDVGLEMELELDADGSGTAAALQAARCLCISQEELYFLEDCSETAKPLGPRNEAAAISLMRSLLDPLLVHGGGCDSVLHGAGCGSRPKSMAHAVRVGATAAEVAAAPGAQAWGAAGGGAAQVAAVPGAQAEAAAGAAAADAAAVPGAQAGAAGGVDPTQTAGAAAGDPTSVAAAAAATATARRWAAALDRHCEAYGAKLDASAAAAATAWGTPADVGMSEGVVEVAEQEQQQQRRLGEPLSLPIEGWVREQGVRSPLCGPAIFDDGLRGMRALEDIPAGTCLLHVPVGVLVSQEVAEASEMGTMLAALPGLAGTETLLLIWTCIDSRDPESQLSPFWRSLPQPGELVTGLSAPEGVVGLLRGTPLHQEMLTARGHVRESYDEVAPLLGALTSAYPDDIPPEAVSWERYLWAAELWYAYAMQVQQPGGEVRHCLVPYACLLNHSSWPHVVRYGRVVTTDGEASSSGGGGVKSSGSGSNAAMRFVMLRPAKRGEQLYLGYGPLPNDKLLLWYGFALQGNPHDALRLDLGPEPCPASTQQAQQQTTQQQQQAPQSACGAAGGSDGSAGGSDSGGGGGGSNGGGGGSSGGGGAWRGLGPMAAAEEEAAITEEEGGGGHMLRTGAPVPGKLLRHMRRLLGPGCRDGEEWRALESALCVIRDQLPGQHAQQQLRTIATFSNDDRGNNHSGGGNNDSGNNDSGGGNTDGPALRCFAAGCLEYLRGLRAVVDGALDACKRES